MQPLPLETKDAIVQLQQNLEEYTTPQFTEIYTFSPALPTSFKDFIESQNYQDYQAKSRG